VSHWPISLSLCIIYIFFIHFLEYSLPPNRKVMYRVHCVEKVEGRMGPSDERLLILAEESEKKKVVDLQLSDEIGKKLTTRVKTFCY
jgi:hypothetical protein